MLNEAECLDMIPRSPFKRIMKLSARKTEKGFLCVRNGLLEGTWPVRAAGKACESKEYAHDRRRTLPPRVGPHIRRRFQERQACREDENYGIDVQIVQPGTCHDLETVRGQHDAIAGLCGEYPGRFIGMANPSPHLLPDAYAGEVVRCVRELGFLRSSSTP